MPHAAPDRSKAALRPRQALRRAILPAALLALAASLPAPAADGVATYAAGTPIALGAASKWDFLAVQPGTGHVFAALGDHLAVVDADTGKALGRIGGLDRAHGVAFDTAHQLGFVSSGGSDSITTFALDTFKILHTTPAGGKSPDALLFLAQTGRLYSFNGKSHDMTVIEPTSGAVQARVALPGKPEVAVGDADRVWVNLEDLHQLAMIDIHSNTLVRSTELPGCVEPTGLAYDAQHQRLFSACSNGRLVVTAADDGRMVASLAIGEEPDGVEFDATRATIIAPSGSRGSVSIIHQDDADHYHVVQTVVTAPKARTLALDARNGKAYLTAPASTGFELRVVAPLPAGAVR
ncbi:MAG: YncE family protein [Pseudomonadota bacterium]|nr:YncE family protein [Pseudomonadota bacterium]